MATILAIETSCDETAVAIVKDRQVLSSIVSSQIDLHRTYGGVVPELASRQHLEWVNPAIAQALADAQLSWAEIDGIASTVTPGLVGALLVGTMAAKSLAMLYGKPFLGVHHLEGHIHATYLDQPGLKPPFLCLLVSGGHTSLIHVKEAGDYTTLGQTRDDAAGEAFDKVARLLGLGYPGGPVIDQLAKQGNAKAFKLPEGRISLGKHQGKGKAQQGQARYHPYDSSFSGLKTAMLRLTERLKPESPLPIADLAASFQYTVAKALTKRAIACARDFNLSTIAVGGGVAANSELRHQLTAAAQAEGFQVFFPPIALCTDNAAMIACAACEHLTRGRSSSLQLPVQSRTPLEKVLSLYE